ncbi:MAG: ATPase, T2SS/T4P/T4SS family, partial [Candidatus Omnitrophota bacterium]
MMRPQLKLGEILVREGVITEDQLQKAIQLQKSERGRIGEVLIRLKLVNEKDIALALGKQLGVPYASLSRGLLQPQLDQGLEQLVPEDFSRRYTLIPLSKNFNSLTVGFSDPLDLIVMDNLRRMTGCEINPIVATPSDIHAALDSFYGKRDVLGEAIESSYNVSAESQPGSLAITKTEMEEGSMSLDKLVQEAEDVPVVKLVDLIVKQAIEDRASDIHIEPFENRISIRYRIDGILYEISPPSPHLLLPLVSRIKILSRLDIAEKRLPQDGGFIVRMKDRIIDMRVSTVPTIYGEKVVVRILDKTAVPLNLAQLGFEPQDLEKFKRTVRAPYGLMFLTGPTGSG